MESDICLSDENFCMEFGSGKDIYFKSRSKGPRSWIIKHIFHGKNAILIISWLIFTIISTLTNSLLSFYIGDTISAFETAQYSDMIGYFVFFLIFGIVNATFFLLSNICREILAQIVEKEVREEFFVNLLGKSLSFHDQQQIGDIMSRATSDIRMLNWLISPALSLIFESILTLGIPIILILLNLPKQLVLSPIIFVILFIISVWRYFLNLGPVTQQMRFNMGQMHAVLNESISGIEVIKELVIESQEKMKYLKYASKYRDSAIQEGKIQARYFPILLISIIITLGLTHALILKSQNLVSIGEVITYIGLLIIYRRPTRISIWAFSVVTKAVSAAERIVSLMNQRGIIDQNTQGIEKQIIGKIEYRDVSFSYPNSKNEVLSNLAFKINPGETIAIVGTTGSGKTTLTKLISRLYDVTKGEILVDDVPIQSYSLGSLRGQISHIEQDVFLFNTSIRDNIDFGRKDDFESIKSAASDAQADDFINHLPNAYETMLGEQGVQLSGGERQRIAIARAFLSDPKILVLDDSTSAIDSKTEDQIQHAIKNVIQNRTTLLITHRLSQIRWADRILLLKKGKLVAQGKHEDLLKESPEYQKIFIKRFDKSLKELLEHD